MFFGTVYVVCAEEERSKAAEAARERVKQEQEAKEKVRAHGGLERPRLVMEQRYGGWRSCRH